MIVRFKDYLTEEVFSTQESTYLPPPDSFVRLPEGEFIVMAVTGEMVHHEDHKYTSKDWLEPVLLDEEGAMIREIFEVFYIDENGKVIDHKDQREHEELTFLDEESAQKKATELYEQGHDVEIWHMGPI